MILRKPYAILIKNFKLIHTIITICMAYLLYRSYLIFDYVRVCLSEGVLNAVNIDLTAELFNNSMFILPGLIIIGLGILLWTMIRKKKPFTFYIGNIVVYIATIVIYSYLFDKLNYMENNIIQVQDLRLMNDFIMMLLLAQFISMILSFIRSVGFDIKKFDFGKDLMELEIQAEDDEEFEINVNVEGNIIKRHFNKNYRYFKYIYKENTLLINSIAIISLSIIGYSIYLGINVYSATYGEGDMFNTDNIVLGVTKSYITKKDHDGNVITEDGKSLLVLEMAVKGNFSESKLNTGKTELKLGDNKYFPTNIEFKDKLFDLGQIYHDEFLTYKVRKTLLIYVVKDVDLKNQNKKMMYLNDLVFEKGKLNPLYINVKINPIDIDLEDERTEMIYGELALLYPNSLYNSSIEIDSFELKEYFKNNYKYCLNSNKCVDSVEYLRAPLNKNYDQALLKINGSFLFDEESEVNYLNNLYNILNYFGYIEYVVDGKKYTLSGGFSRVLPAKLKEKNTYYIAVNKNILNSSSAKLVIKFRNNIYEYKIM